MSKKIEIFGYRDTVETITDNMIVIMRRNGERDIIPIKHTEEGIEVMVDSIVTLCKRPMTPEDKEQYEKDKAFTDSLRIN